MRLSIEMEGLQKTISRLNRFEKNKTNDVKQVINEYGHIIEAQAVALAPVDKGNLKVSMTLEFKDKDMTAEISNSAKYAADVEFGTAPHEIRPKPESGKKALFWDGAKHPVKVVHHPGTKAQPFLFPAFDMNKRSYVDKMRRVLREPER